jgi:hypothetical protein
MRVRYQILLTMKAEERWGPYQTFHFRAFYCNERETVCKIHNVSTRERGSRAKVQPGVNGRLGPGGSTSIRKNETPPVGL